MASDSLSRRIEDVDGDDLTPLPMIPGMLAAALVSTYIVPSESQSDLALLGMIVVVFGVFAAVTVVSVAVEREITIYWRIRDAALQDSTNDSERGDANGK